MKKTEKYDRKRKLMSKTRSDKEMPYYKQAREYTSVLSSKSRIQNSAKPL